MGNCCCANDDAHSQVDGNERDRLLGNPVGNTPSCPVNGPIEYGSRNNHDANDKGDEQSALNRILHQTASNVIDVSGMNSHTLEQHEYVERTRHYNQKITNGQYQKHVGTKPNFLSDVPAPEKILASESIHPDDYLMVSELAVNVNSALSTVTVQHKEDLVVQFGIP